MPPLDRLTAALQDRYRIERELGAGGMATVYVAEDLRHGRRVALKVMAADIAAALGAERFQREIEIASGLHHPHILSLFDSGEAAGQLYYTMPLVEGESLRARLERETQLPVDEAVQIAREVADALAYAHSRGLVHRDVKPENILLENGHALLADFGIARAVGAADAEGRLTATGIAVGTAAYMSPEQAAAERRIDGRSDIYALGCVLYEMLAGEPPYTGPTAQAIAARRLLEAPRSLRVVRDAVPPALEATVMKALARVPADRWPTAAQFDAALGAGGAAGMPASTIRRGRRWMVGAASLLLVGGAAVLTWRALGHRMGSGGTPRLAVLPFENLGPADQQYFADGISDEVRGRLTLVSGLTVVARASSVSYRQTTKAPQQIGRELGVTYLLTGTVRWEKRSDGTTLVHVSPELIRVSDAAARWEETFDASQADVFQVQAGIATRVAQALNLALSAPERARMAAAPTQNLAAYDAFLQGDEVSQGLGAVDPATMARAVEFYRRAVGLDSSFALAWARLAAAHVLHYTYDAADDAEVQESHTAATRALALAPDLIEAHVALAMYYTLGVRDQPAALAEWDRAQSLAPQSNAEVLNGRGLTEQFLGRWEASAADLRQARSLDPRSVPTYVRLTRALLWLRTYPEALAANDSALALAPANLVLIQNRAMIFLAQGDLPRARAALRAVPSEVERSQLVALMITVGDLYWVLDDADQTLVLTRSAESLGLDRVSWALARAQIYDVRGDRARSQTYADSAAAAVESPAGQVPMDPGALVLHGLADGLRGRASDAVREEEQVLTFPVTQNGFGGRYDRLVLVKAHIRAGQKDQALEHLAPLLEQPFYLSPGWLRIDPAFVPLRGDAKFERLARG